MMKIKKGDIIVVKRCFYYDKGDPVCSKCINYTHHVNRSDCDSIDFVSGAVDCFLNTDGDEKDEYRKATDREAFLYYACGSLNVENM